MGHLLNPLSFTAHQTIRVVITFKTIATIAEKQNISTEPIWTCRTHWQFERSCINDWQRKLALPIATGQF